MMIDLLNILIGLGAGSIVTAVLNKLLNMRKEKISLKKDSQEIADSQIAFLSTINEKLNETVEKLQNVACYFVDCKHRINGLQNHTATSRKKPSEKRHDKNTSKG